MITMAAIEDDKKQKTRHSMKKLRDSMINVEAEEKSAAIIKVLEGLNEYEKAGTILFYAAKGNEVRTRKAIESAIKKGKAVLLPITNMKTREIELGEAKSYGELIRGEFGILEPRQRSEIPLWNIDMVVVPGLAFDREGHRLGYGLGFYDRLLHKLPQATKIGLAYDSQIVERLPREKHDHPMDIVVMESRIVRIEGQANGRKPEH